MSGNAKVLRGQMRQIVQELLPQVLIQEQYKELEKVIIERLQVLEKETKKTMHEMNERHKNVMGMLVRSASEPVNKT